MFVPDTVAAAQVRTRRRIRLIVSLAAAVAAAVVFGGCTTGATAPYEASKDPLNGRIKPSRYQAVFLTNDRVYFGHLKSVGGGWYRLTKAHYIREKTDPKAKTASQQVAPVSEELQQPDDGLLINADQVVLVENLKPDSRVAAAIASLGT